MNDKKLLLLIILLLSGCTQKKAVQVEKTEVLSETDRFFINEQKLKKLAHFTYGAKIEFTIGQGSNLKTSAESIEIVADEGRLLLKKSTDSSHFIELFKNGDSFLVKNQGQAWRREDSPLYQKIMDESLNMVGWLTSQLAILESGNKLVVKDAQINKDAPMLKALAMKPEYSVIKSAKVSAVVSFDQKLAIPEEADFLVDILSEQGRFIKIKASMALKQVGVALVMPTATESLSPGVPVNLSSRFNQLMSPVPSK